MLSIPLLAAYTIGNTIIKYREGFIQVPELGIIPKPHSLWQPSAQRAIFPLTLCFALAWGLEMVTHLEELCFWLYLVNSTSRNQDWFKSLYFKTWMIGSLAAVIYMPLVTIFTRQDPLKSEAYTFLAGSLGSFSLTLWFLPILYMFPGFLSNLKSEGVDIGTIARLTKFEELNRIRVLFRFFFCVPLLVLGIDGVRPHHHINESMVLTDILVILTGFGVAVSSGITLVIFFPRSIEGEIAAKDAEKERKRTRTGHSTFGHSASFLGSHGPSRMNTFMSESYSYDQTTSVVGHDRAKPRVDGSQAYPLTSSPTKTNFRRNSYDGQYTEDGSHPGHEGKSIDKYWDDEQRDVAAPLPPIRPNRRRGTDIELGGVDKLSETNLSVHNLRLSNVHPLVHNFTSPIDLGYAAEPEIQAVKPKYTFKK